jgi:hypothetical protein
VRVPRGTRIKEISEGQLREECNVYSDAGVDDLDKVQRHLKAIRRKYKPGASSSNRKGKRNASMLLQEICDNVSLLLNEAPEV